MRRVVCAFQSLPLQRPTGAALDRLQEEAAAAAENMAAQSVLVHICFGLIMAET